MRRTPLKGEPDFSPYTDEQVNEMHIDIQRMIGAFDYDPEMVKTLTKCFKAISEERLFRMSKVPPRPEKVSDIRGTSEIKLLKRKEIIKRKLTSRK